MHILCGAAEVDCDEFGKKEKEGSLVLVADPHALNEANSQDFLYFLLHSDKTRNFCDLAATYAIADSISKVQGSGRGSKAEDFSSRALVRGTHCQVACNNVYT
ncbi:hypothetical protein TIFTF001_004165 [Ficus carica]|uniref:Uncharacterized protein n=1 Tax=Ficus carica TaxID=3494 RepID=A0AA87ZF27_FICCA|nr:hypothetical protein TIFTF001_004165 [Ficus carica]